MKKIKSILVLFIAFSFIGCFDDGDDNFSPNEINDFVYKGMSIFYLYKDNVPVLANDRFSNDAEYFNYINEFSDPFDLFESLKYQSGVVDRFSWIVDDYFELERQFQGTSGTNGMEFSLFNEPNSNNGVYGVVRLVLPNSDADTKGIKRGDIFYAIDGVDLFYNSESDNNFNLFNSETYTVNFATYDTKGTQDTSDDTVDANNESTSLTKAQYTENPVFASHIHEVNGEKVGYVMYNGFTRGFEDELNEVFGNFKSNNIQHLVLDLRYNPGGSVAVETYLASMITGQFTNELFTQLVYNSNFNTTDYNFTNEISDDGGAINSLGLNKVYVLATSRSASASEGLINGLDSYIDVVHLGSNTTGKTQASRTLYDSPNNNYQREGANQNHTYAMQPLIADGVNKEGIKVPSTGLIPDIEFRESALNYGTIGDINEPFLAAALAQIGNNTTKLNILKAQSDAFNKDILKDSNDFINHKGGMIID